MQFDAVRCSSMQFDVPDRSFDCLLPMMRANSVGTLYEATRGWGVIDHNLVAANISGRIGHLARTRVPRRHRASGWLPVPGWISGHEWDGVVAFEQIPRTESPPGEVIVIAKNRVVPYTDEPCICTDALPPYWAQRVAHHPRRSNRVGGLAARRGRLVGAAHDGSSAYARQGR